MGRHIVGLDIGGTKTRLVAVERVSGRRSVDVRVPTRGWQGTSPPERGILISQLLHDHGVPDAEILVIGARGVDSDQDSIAVQHEVSRWRGGTILALNDAQLLGPGMEDFSAIGLVAGTGSVAVRDNGEQTRLAGGRGWFLSDDGSATGMVRSAVRALLRLNDAGDTDTILLNALREASGARDLRELLRMLVQLDFVEWAGWIPAVFAARAAGSAAATAVVADGAAELVRLVRGLQAQGVESTTAVMSGGVVAHQTDYVSLVRDGLADIGVDGIVARREPVDGALRIAEHLTDPTDHPRIEFFRRRALRSSRATT